MKIEIWDRETLTGETVTMVIINRVGTQYANHDAAFEYLEGLVKELKAAVDTATTMYLRMQPDTKPGG